MSLDGVSAASGSQGDEQSSSSTADNGDAFALALANARSAAASAAPPAANNAGADLAKQGAAIDAFYINLFGRAALPDEKANIEQAVQPGQTLDSVLTPLRQSFAHSAAETGTVNAFYQQSFQRNATSDELGDIEGALGAGQSLLSIEVGLNPIGILNNPTLATIDDFYQRLFRRNAVPSEVDSFMHAASSGVSVQDYAASLRPIFAKSDSETGVINSFYQETAGRPANPGELANIEGALGAGQSLADIENVLAPPLVAVAQAQQQAQANAIDATYRQVLGRGASAAELSDRQRDLASGQTLLGMRSALARSGEAAANINQVYQDLFGFGVDNASLAVIQAQIAGGASFSDYRGMFAKTNAGVQSDLNDAFMTNLGRPPSAAEQDYWLGRLSDGASIADMRAALSSYQGLDHSLVLWLDEQIPPPGDPATDPQSGYAPASTPITLLGADGSTLAATSARDLLSVLPVYVTLNNGLSPTARLQDGRIATFDNAAQLADYLMRTAQHTSPADPLLSTAYGQTSAWLQQVDQPALQAASRFAQLARANATSNPDLALLDRAASALAVQVVEQDPAARHGLSTKLQHAGHQTVISVAADGSTTFHDIDPGVFPIVEAVVTVAADVLAIAFPPVGAPLAAAVHLAEAGQAFSDGNTIGGLLNIASAAGLGLKYFDLPELSAIVRLASQVTGGTYSVAQGAERGDPAGILGGLLTTAGGVAAGLGLGKVNFSIGDIPSNVVLDRLQQTLSAAGALTSFGSQVAQGNITEGLVNSLGPWLANLAAASYADENLSSSGIDGALSGVGGSESYPTANEVYHPLSQPAATYSDGLKDDLDFSQADANALGPKASLISYRPAIGQLANSGILDVGGNNSEFHNIVQDAIANQVRAQGGIAIKEVQLYTISDQIGPRPDLLVQLPGHPMEFIDVKTGDQPRPTELQGQYYPLIPVGGHLVSNDPRITQFGLKIGEPLPPTYFTYVTQRDANSDIQYDTWHPRY